MDDTHVGPALRNTLLQDRVPSPEDAIIEIYKRLRPGDPPTIETATTFFNNLFFNAERYDLSRVGRLKLNHRLGLDAPLEQGTLRRDEQGIWHTPWDSADTDYQQLPLPSGLRQAIDGRLRELSVDAPVRATILLLNYDAKRIHFFAELHHAKEGWISATSEQLALHVDMQTRRVAPWPDDVLERLAAMKAAHAAVPPLEGVGRPIGMPRPT